MSGWSPEDRTIWLTLVAAMLAVAAIVAGVAGAAEGDKLRLDNAGLVIAYLCAALAVLAFIAALRGWRFPLRQDEAPPTAPESVGVHTSDQAKINLRNSPIKGYDRGADAKDDSEINLEDSEINLEDSPLYRRED